MKAVHFGAGSIGRGFVGLLLHEAGHELVFSDVSAELVDALNAVSSYTVHEVGPGGSDKVVTRFRAINSAEHPEEVIDEISVANVVTTAVGPPVLKFLAPLILSGLALRDPAAPPLQIMACENAINATDVLRDHIRERAGAAWDAIVGRAIFANTAVDRIVPEPQENRGLDVTVEPFYEWAIERTPFGDLPPVIPGAHFVHDLAPYIERTLFTVTTGHSATAYFGALAGVQRISDALAVPEIEARVRAALGETSALLVAKHELDPHGLAEYRERILDRFRNPALPDTVWRVGRQPLRQLSRHERFVGPAAEAAERGLPVTALVEAMGAALGFDDGEDPQSVEMQRMLREDDAETFTAVVTGLDPDHPLFPRVAQSVARRQRELA